MYNTISQIDFVPHEHSILLFRQTCIILFYVCSTIGGKVWAELLACFCHEKFQRAPSKCAFAFVAAQLTVKAAPTHRQSDMMNHIILLKVCSLYLFHIPKRFSKHHGGKPTPPVKGKLLSGFHSSLTKAEGTWKY